MKRIIGILLAFLIFMMYGCGKKADIDITECEIVSAGETYNVKFTLQNNTKSDINGLSINVSLIDENGEETGRAQGTYPIAVKPGEKATLSIKDKKGIAQAKALSYSYIAGNGESVSADFENEYIAKINKEKKEDGVIRTREDVAEELIKDIKFRFHEKKYLTEGEYDTENNRLIIASYCDLSLNECKASYRINPDQWDELAQSMADMSNTCLDEFGKYGFEDVHVSIGFMSKDNNIVISAADGEIVDTLSE